MAQHSDVPPVRNGNRQCGKRLERRAWQCKPRGGSPRLQHRYRDRAPRCRRDTVGDRSGGI